MMVRASRAVDLVANSATLLLAEALARQSKTHAAVVLPSRHSCE